MTVGRLDEKDPLGIKRLMCSHPIGGDQSGSVLQYNGFHERVPEQELTLLSPAPERAAPGCIFTPPTQGAEKMTNSAGAARISQKSFSGLRLPRSVAAAIPYDRRPGGFLV